LEVNVSPLPLSEVVAALERLYPARTASSWDRVGLVTGDLDQPVSLVHFAVDPTLAVIDQARAAGADLLITHHPLLLRGVHSVATISAKGAAVTALIVNHIALFVAHTNADVASVMPSPAPAACARWGPWRSLTGWATAGSARWPAR
jgi:putative NIF3 family GTP cyclohydrolase 1 type 2